MSDVDPDDEATMAGRDLLRSVTTSDRDLERPPPSVWAAIEAEIAAPEAPVVPLRRGLSVRRWLAAAAAVLLVVVGIGVVVDRRGSDGDEVLATAELTSEGLPAAPDRLTATAQLLDTADGVALAIDVDASAPAGSFLEVWLIDDAVERIVSLGVVDAASGRYGVPAELDLGEFPIVDVSIEPDDGDPSHSGDSILRGRFDA